MWHAIAAEPHRNLTLSAGYLRLVDVIAFWFLQSTNVNLHYIGATWLKRLH